ncbi:MAG: AAA family ATPase [bacterium]|nr:AAA family ATPase [bacterium]
MAKTQILHISDLHITGNKDISKLTALGQLFDRIELDKKNGFRPELVVVSGDVAFSGTKAEYNNAKSFFDSLLIQLNLPEDRLYIVPGNHDVDLKAYRPTDIPEYKSMKELNNELKNEEFRADLLKGMGNYFEFIETQYPHIKSRHNRLVPFVNSYNTECGKQIGLVGLNSAWMSRRNSQDKGRIAIGEYQVRMAEKYLVENKQNDLNLFIFHHPIEWLWKKDSEAIEQYLYNSVLLCGHQVEKGLFNLDFSNQGFHQFQTGGSYMRNGLLEPNMFQYINFDWDKNEIRLDVSKYHRSTQKWEIDGSQYFNMTWDKKDFVHPKEISEKKIKIVTLKINNVKCFDDVIINFNSHTNTGLIIGPNSRGKTAILQLIALGLRGVKNVPFPYNWKNVVKTGANTGLFEINLLLNDALIPLKFEIDENDGISCIEGEDRLNSIKDNFLLLAYGSNRQIKLEDTRPYIDIEPVATLFGENGYLKHIKASSVFKYLDDKFDAVQELVNKVLDISYSKTRVFLTSYDSNSLYFTTSTNPDDLIPIEALSEGFKSTFVWLFDMIIEIIEGGGDINNIHDIPGIILLDDIDLHLHPGWQRTILPSLEKNFPSIQFIATTHSPFVVQSTKNENLIILELDDAKNSVQIVNKERTSELSYSAIVREIFNIKSPFNKTIEDEFDKFKKIQKKIRNNEDFDEEEFIQLALDLAEKGVEAEGVVRREIMSLEQRTGKVFNLWKK